MRGPNRNISILLKFFAANKPSWLTPTMRVVVEELLLSSFNESMETWVSIRYLAEKCNVSYRTVARALKVLLHKDHRWVTKQSGKSDFDTNTYAVQISALPLEREDIRRIISVDAYYIAQRYLELCKALPKRPSKKNPGRMYSAYRVRPNHKQRWELLAQEWLDEGLTKSQVDKLVETAFLLYPGTARHGMHALRGKFTALCRAAQITPGDAMPTKQMKLAEPEEISI